MVSGQLPGQLLQRLWSTGQLAMYALAGPPLQYDSSTAPSVVKCLHFVMTWAFAKANIMASQLLRLDQESAYISSLCFTVSLPAANWSSKDSALASGLLGQVLI